MEMRKVLVIFANPRGTTPLRLGEEDRTIRECVRLSAARALEVITQHAATVDDLRRALLEYRPQILHISGHGSDDGLYLEDNSGNEHCIDPGALAELISLSDPPVDTVVLNACFSQTHADEFELFKVPCLIAMSTAVSDRGAIEFTKGFYDSLAAGEDVESAFDHGRVNMKAHGLDDHVVLLHKGIEAPRVATPTEPENLPKVVPALPAAAPVETPPFPRPTPVDEPAATQVVRKRRFWRKTKMQVAAVVTFLGALAVLIGYVPKAYKYMVGRPQMKFLDVVDDGNKLRFTVENNYRKAVVLEKVRMVPDAELAPFLTFGQVTPLPHKFAAGTIGDLDIEIERIVWKKVGQHERPGSLLDVRGHSGIDVEATATTLSGKTMTVSSHLTLEQIRAFVVRRGTPCDDTLEGC